jgi:CRISPR system Cascade subunit CasC
MKLLELHILQSFPVSCLNRDDVGAPKSAVFGGVTRARISSQCLKRAIREYAQELCPTPFQGERSRLIVRPLRDAIVEQGIDESRAESAAKEVADYLASVDKEAEKKGTLRVKTLIFLSPSERRAIAEALAKTLKKDPDAKDLGKAAGKILRTLQPKDACSTLARTPCSRLSNARAVTQPLDRRRSLTKAGLLAC